MISPTRRQPNLQQSQVWCGRSRNSGACQGGYRSRLAVEAAVGLWLQGQVRERKEGSSLIFPEAQAKRQDPHNAERQRLNKLLDRADTKIERLLDAYTEGALELAQYKARREVVQRDVEQARRRLNELDQPEPQAPSAADVSSFADLWSTTSVEDRRSVVTAMLEQVRVNRDKTVVLVPRWSPSTTVTYSGRTQVPALQPAPPSTS